MYDIVVISDKIRIHVHLLIFLQSLHFCKNFLIVLHILYVFLVISQNLLGLGWLVLIYVITDCFAIFNVFCALNFVSLDASVLSTWIKVTRFVEERDGESLDL